MAPEIKQVDETEIKEAPPTEEVVIADTPSKEAKIPERTQDRGNRRQMKNERRPKRPPRAKPEFDQRMLSLRRVTRVSAGGRRFSFSVAMVVGNHKGVVGVGTGKGGDTSLAIDKAARDARKNSIIVKTTDSMSIPHEVFTKFKSVA